MCAFSIILYILRARVSVRVCEYSRLFHKRFSTAFGDSKDVTENRTVQKPIANLHFFIRKCSLSRFHRWNIYFSRELLIAEEEEEEVSASRFRFFVVVLCLYSAVVYFPFYPNSLFSIPCSLGRNSLVVIVVFFSIFYPVHSHRSLHHPFGLFRLSSSVLWLVHIWFC